MKLFGDTQESHNKPDNYLLLKSTAVLEVHAFTAQGMSGNSFKGMLIFQMLLDINKAPNWRAEIQFERCSPWRCRDVYPRLHISPASEASQSSAVVIAAF